ncbi:GNAT superfamily N-acetyltransferase [Actinoplanes campanulatus]|uniref:GNAT superfamily N-acetyltransferase n=1 Tax=Actinoplanes campanulatus TaxID=113559 RepID=A0A7W5AK44_9ACTN|nr:GNAT family N-acetyltransferase [Actinoplanes campanulatus]MBB3097582.1 GNAT superfamily N-acetyltransferase [Actinoplanes campanulatus]GGN27691.1 N-acetyltransferase [Actinoplanes campanulatus]GID37955.1 N-acetyltransferase [Actinoplanes campanulatus]
MTVSLRPAEDGDLAAIGALHHRSRAAAYAHLIPAETFAARGPEAMSAWWVERWRWERETHRMTVAEVDGELAGFTYLGPSETEGAAELYAIHLAPERVGAGVGRRLMIDALERLAGFGAERAVLWVLEDNAVARRFYEKGGWLPDGAVRVAPVNDRDLPQLRYSHPL